MCKTIQDSLQSGIISYTTGAVLIWTGQPKYIWLGAFVLIIGTMQWVDAILWRLKEQGLPTKEFSQYAVIGVLILEPLIAYLGYVYYSGHRMPLYEAIYGVTALCMVYTWFRDCQETTITEDGYLKWCDIRFKSTLNKTIFIALLFFPMGFFPDVLLRNILMLLAGVLWLYNFNHEAFGSRWCHSFMILDAVILGRLFMTG